MNLPDDMAAGDTISGTVFAEPSGAAPEEKEKHTDELHGYVVEIDQDKAPVAGRTLRWAVPALAGAAATLRLMDKDGNEVGRTQVPVHATPYVGARPAAPGPQDFFLPPIGQAGPSPSRARSTGISPARPSRWPVAKSTSSPNPRENWWPSAPGTSSVRPPWS